MNRLAFLLYLFFLFSWFTHLTSRLPFLGVIRFDLILIGAIFIASTISIVSSSKKQSSTGDRTTHALTLLIVYVIFTIPLVEWPGSSLDNFQQWLKYLAFYYFTVTLVGTEKRVKIFLAIFIALQTFRVAEPLYLHITEGYWGSTAFMRDWEYMNRLAGAPHDVINPNGLAFVIISIFPFLFYFRLVSFTTGVICLLAMSMSMYALILTGSRSGMLGLGVCLAVIIYNSKRKFLSAAVIIPVALLVLFSLSGDLSDRYISIFDPTARNADTAEGRLESLKHDLELSLRRPVFGHGLGTSTEASSHFTGRYQPSHNLYAEVAIELGLLGLALFLFYLKGIFQNVLLISKNIISSPQNKFISSCQKAMLCWLIMNVFFSFASYGLSSYEWYLFGGLSIALLKICNGRISSPQKKPLHKQRGLKSVTACPA
jgi:O-antigen ligase